MCTILHQLEWQQFRSLTIPITKGDYREVRSRNTGKDLQSRKPNKSHRRGDF